MDQLIKPSIRLVKLQNFNWLRNFELGIFIFLLKMIFFSFKTKFEVEAE